jgi:hypothetical protein
MTTYGINRTRCANLQEQLSHIYKRAYKKCLKKTKKVIRILISKKNRQHNGQKKKYKRTNNDLQNIHIKLKIE